MEEKISEKEKWKRVIKYMGENPSFLLDAMPSANKETYAAFISSKS